MATARSNRRRRPKNPNCVRWTTEHQPSSAIFVFIKAWPAVAGIRPIRRRRRFGYHSYLIFFKGKSQAAAVRLANDLLRRLAPWHRYLGDTVKLERL